MPKWNTQKIISDLEKLTGIKKIENSGQGGDVDTDNLCLSFTDTKERLFVCGFTPDADITTPDNVNVKMIELSDGLDSSGGLNSTSKNLATHYVEVRQYFVNKKFHVVPRLKDYF